jgi:hypothetical protein
MQARGSQTDYMAIMTLYNVPELMGFCRCACRSKSTSYQRIYCVLAYGAARSYPGEVLLDENALQIAPELLAVWRKEKRRLLQTPPLDTLLPILLNDTKYTHYTSVGQQLCCTHGVDE